MDGEFPGTHHTHCVMCDAKLRWPRVMEQGEAASARRYYQRISKERLAAGLTTRGTPWKRRPTGLRPSAAVQRRSSLDRYRRRASKHVSQGLTTRGTEPVYDRHPDLRGRRLNHRTYSRLWHQERAGRLKPARMTDKEWAWRQLRAAMEIQVPEILSDIQRAEVA